MKLIILSSPKVYGYLLSFHMVVNNIVSEKICFVFSAKPELLHTGGSQPEICISMSQSPSSESWKLHTDK